MAKESGIGMTVGLDDSTPTLRQIENGITALTFSTPRGVADWTGVNSSAMERGLLLADFSASLTGPFDDGALTGLHTVIKNIGSTSVTRTLTFVHSAQTLTNECLATDQQWNRDSSGSLIVTVPLVLNSTTVPTWS